MDEDYEGIGYENDGPEDFEELSGDVINDSNEVSDIFEDYESVEDVDNGEVIDSFVETSDSDDFVPVLQDEESMDIIEESFGIDNVENSDDVVNLDLLDDIPEDRTYDDFELTVMEDAPDFYDSGEFYTQGINEYGFSGTCGPTSQANALNELFDTNEFTENNILDIAVENDLCNISEIPECSGGTTTEQFMELYDKVNDTLDDKIQTELYEYDEALDVDEAAAKIEEGDVLNVAVDSATLWDEEMDYVDPLGVPCDELYSDHWITVTDVHRDSEGNVEGFDIIDSGGGVDYVDADKYHEICFGTDDRKVLDPTTIVVSKN